MQVYNEKEQTEQGKIQNVGLRRKGAPGRVIELRTVLKQINRLKKSLILNGIKGMVNSWQGSTQLSFQFAMKRNFKSFGASLMTHAFKPSTQKAEADDL